MGGSGSPLLVPSPEAAFPLFALAVPRRASLPSRGVSLQHPSPNPLCVDLATLKAVLGPRLPKAGVVQLQSWVLLPRRSPAPGLYFYGVVCPSLGPRLSISNQFLGHQRPRVGVAGLPGTVPSEWRVRASRNERMQTLHFLIRKTGIIPIMQKISAKPLTKHKTYWIGLRFLTAAWCSQVTGKGRDSHLRRQRANTEM